MNHLGQLFIIGISGKSLSSEEANFIEEENIGGVVLFSHNYESPAQLAELVNSIQKLRDEYPLYISVDHEGGRVQRFKDGFSIIPPMSHIAKLASPKKCYEVYKIASEELLACGVNLNFAPCADILLKSDSNAIGDRSFGDSAEEVSKYVSASIRGMQTEGMMACAKHFVGHGATSKDSHLELPIIKRTMDELKGNEFLPFIKAAKSRVGAIMVAHLVVDAIDEKLPGSLSEKTYKLIRNELKYNKILITDDMDMHAISKNWSVEEAATMALVGGADILLYRNFESAQTAYKNLRELLKIKKIKNSLVIDKYNRVMESKKLFLSNYKPIYIPDLSKKLKTNKSKQFLDELLNSIPS